LKTTGPRLSRQSGLTLLELLIVLAIIAVAITILLPAVHRVREGAHRIQCANHLRQIGLAFQLHHDVLGSFPTAGTHWNTPPTYLGGAPATGGLQGAGWGFQILPYLEGGNTWTGGGATTDNDRQRVAVGTINPIFFCPSRRAPMTFTFADHYISRGPGDAVTHALCDYASNNLDDDSGVVRANGFGPAVRITDVTDGTSTTLLVGEKRLNLYYLGQLRLDDNEGYTCGNDWDTMRNANYPPARDSNEPSGERGFAQFGSSHPSGMNFVFADGSVHHISFTINPSVLSRLGARADGQPLDGNDF
jgi:prepilin-type N-terminal cleavage/methylation domain-containing protein/prepilin-type processing-associated H-X9-DG protein